MIEKGLFYYFSLFVQRKKRLFKKSIKNKKGILDLLQKNIKMLLFVTYKF